MTNPKTTLCFFAALFVLLMSGCVNESTSGESQTFTYELWVPASVLIFGVVASVAGWFLRSSLGRFGWALLILGPLAALFGAPSLFLDRAVVDETRFTLRTGIWGMTSVHEVEYDELKRVSVISEEVRGRRGRKSTNYYLECQRNDGTKAKIPVNNKVGETAAPHFLKRVSELGVPVVDNT